MPEKKKQHYVPRLCLKNFAEDGFVNIYSLNDGKLIKNVGYKPQCQKDYFYGNTGTEDLLQIIEDKTNSILQRILDSAKIEDDDYSVMLKFITLQIVRTEKEVNRFSEDITNMLNDTLALTTKNGRYLNRDFFSAERDVNFTLVNKYWRTLSDLKYSVIKNNSSTQFIFSDNPVVRYNQYYKDDDIINQVGAQCKGLLIMLPLNPSTLILLYDKETYLINDIVEVRDDDIDKINILQTLSAGDILITHPSVSKNLLIKYHKIKIMSPPIDCISGTFKSGINRFVIYRQPPKLNFKQELSFIQYKDGKPALAEKIRKIHLRKYWEEETSFL